MNSKYIDELNKNLNNLILNNTLKEKFIIVFGANKPAEKTILYLNSKNILVNAIIDNNKSKSGKKMLGITIFTPEELLAEFNKKAVILIASQYYKEMKSQLENMKYTEKVNIFQTVKYKHYTVEKKYFDEKISDVYRGYDIFKNIQDKYGKGKTILICPYRGIGDIYFICSYIQEYLRKSEISNYIFTVIGNTCKKIADMFNIKNIEVLSQGESDNLVDLYRIIKNEESSIKVLSHNYIHIDILEKFEASNKFSWGDLFKNCVMEIDKNSCKTKPSFSFRKEYVEDLFNSNKLIKGKTVVLSPYANTIMRLEDEFWMSVVNQLTKKGYKVCTNSIGTEEPPIDGTVPLKFSLEDAISIVEYAGMFIGIRSGFCDLISSAKAKKVIIYPDDKSLFFSIKDMGLSCDVIELSISRDIKATIERII